MQGITTIPLALQIISAQKGGFKSCSRLRGAGSSLRGAGSSFKNRLTIGLIKIKSDSLHRRRVNRYQ